MSAKHTPGPWQVAGTRHSGDLRIGPDTRLHAVGPDEDAVCMVFFDMKTGRGWSDARLIAAAPAMLAALHDIADRNDHLDGLLTIQLIARDAIAKAEGTP